MTTSARGRDGLGGAAGRAAEVVSGRAAAAALFAGPGEVRELARTLDWGATPLRWPDTWSPALRIATRAMLDAPHPICLWSGPAYALVYNDAYRRILAAKHPGALGQPGSVVWAEIWEALAPQFAQVSAGGPAVYGEDARFVMARLEGGRTEDAWFSYSLSALRDEDGDVVAVLNISPETTARVRAEQALEAERARLAEVVRLAPAFMAVLRGPNHVIALTNAGYDALVGGRDVRGRSVAEALPEAAAQGFVALLDEVLASGAPFVGREVPYRRPDDTGNEDVRYVDFVYQALTEVDGTRSGVFVHGVDVTAQVRARGEVERLLAAERAARAEAEAAAARAALLQELTAALSQALTREQVAAVVIERISTALGAHLGVLALVTPAGDRLAVAAAERLREETWRAWATFPLEAPVPLAEAARLGHAVVLPTFDAIAAHAPTIADLCRTYGTEAMCALPVAAPDGRVLGALGLSFPAPRALADELGLLETLAGQAAQALERARLFEAEHAARGAAEVAEARLRDVFEQAPVSVAVLTGPDHVYSIVSPLYAETPGGGRTLLGRSVREAFPELEGTGYVETMDRVYVTGEPFAAAERRVLLRGGDGALVEHYLNIGYQALRDREGHIYAVASATYDVTGQVRARREVEMARAEAERQRAAAHAANQAKSEFLSTMSHELRTPLNAIGGYAELLTLGLRGPVTDAQRQDLERLRRANQHMTGLVESVLNFARLDAGQVEYHFEAVRLGPVVADLEALVGPQFAAKGLAYDHDACGPDTRERPHVAWADAEKVRQILLNLLTNAAKFTDAGGRVTLACDTETTGVVRVRVADTGRGIAADQLDRVFEPFVQLDRQRTHASQQGVGLGLAISRDLARGMGGDLTAESEPGVGSTFTLTLPAAT